MAATNIAAYTSTISVDNDADGQVSGVEQSLGSREQERVEIVYKLLGGPVSPDEFLKLGYELDAWHVGVIARGTDALKFVLYVAVQAGCELLSVTGGGTTKWAWFGMQRRSAVSDIESVFVALEESGVSVAIGELREGVEGWRLTHCEAGGAALVGRYKHSTFTRYRDVAIEATALRDGVLADSLIRCYLSPLDDEHGGGVQRRRVVRALFIAEYNKSSAAQALCVDRETIHRHVREIERRLGRRLHECHAEIDIALRIEELREHRGDSEALRTS